MGNGLKPTKVNYSRLHAASVLIPLELDGKPPKDTIGQEIAKNDQPKGILPKFNLKIGPQSGLGLVVTLAIIYLLIQRVS